MGTRSRRKYYMKKTDCVKIRWTASCGHWEGHGQQLTTVQTSWGHGGKIKACAQSVEPDSAGKLT